MRLSFRLKQNLLYASNFRFGKTYKYTIYNLSCKQGQRNFAGKKEKFTPDRWTNAITTLSRPQLTRCFLCGDSVPRGLLGECGKMYGMDCVKLSGLYESERQAPSVPRLWTARFLSEGFRRLGFIYPLLLHFNGLMVFTGLKSFA